MAHGSWTILGKTLELYRFACQEEMSDVPLLFFEAKYHMKGVWGIFHSKSYGTFSSHIFRELKNTI